LISFDAVVSIDGLGFLNSFTFSSSVCHNNHDIQSTMETDQIAIFLTTPDLVFDGQDILDSVAVLLL